jgi:glycosyltransferase involved in cell wall biosynthesis
MIPIVIKTRNRPDLLAWTLSSLLATAPGCEPWVIDDGSDDPAALAYLRGEIPAPPPATWPDDGDWLAHVGRPPALRPGGDLPREVRVMLHVRLGIVGGHMHYARLAAQRFPDAEWLLMAEDDAIFVEDWPQRLACLLAMVPPDTAFVSLYDRHDTGGHGWRTIPMRPMRNRWGYHTPPLAGGVAYALRRAAVHGPEFAAEYDVRETAGDAMIQCALARLGYRCVTACPSLCQHTGHASSARPGMYLRFVRHLAAPLVWR